VDSPEKQTDAWITAVLNGSYSRVEALTQLQ